MSTLVENSSEIESQLNQCLQESIQTRERKAFGKMMAKFIAVVRETRGQKDYQDLIRPMTESMGLHRLDSSNIEKGGV